MKRLGEMNNLHFGLLKNYLSAIRHYHHENTVWYSDDKTKYWVLRISFNVALV